jgi:transposase
MRQCGTVSAYTAGCRCDACRAANTKRQREYMRHKARMSWGEAQPLRVDATRSRVHVLYLMQHGMGYREIAKMSGVSTTVIARLGGCDQTKPAKQVKPETETKILAVHLEPVYADPTVSSRKLQALVALGYTQSYLAQRIGTTPGNMTPMIRGIRNITRRHVRAINELYDELQGTPGPSKQVRDRALKLGWLPPLAWDDIEDLNERPAKANVRKVRQRDILHHEDLLELVAQGLSFEAIAQRYNMSVNSVSRNYYRTREQVPA